MSKSLPAMTRARVLAVLGGIAVGFLSFILFTSNPFDRILPIYPVDGSDLNPLLQDPGMVSKILQVILRKSMPAYGQQPRWQ